MLPEGWAKASLLDVVDLHDNRRIPLNQAERATKPGDFPYFGANGQVDTVGEYLFDGDHILIAEDGGYFDNPTKAVAYEVSGRFWVNNHAHIVSSRGGIPHRFLSKVLNTVDWMSFVSGTTRLKLTQGGMERITIPLPPLAEQRRIVAKLEALSARLTRARADLERVPVLANAMRSEALHAAFSLPSSTSPLANLATYITSGSRGWAQYYSDVGAAFIRVGDVRRGAINLRLENLQRVQPPAGSEGSRTALQQGDVIITITADLGRVGVVSDELGPAFVNQHVALVRPVDPFQAKWIAWYLTSEGGQQQLLAKDRGITKAGLGLEDIRQVDVPLVKEHESNAIIERLESAFARADRFEAEAACARALLDRLEAAILSKAFRGELVPQDPADEPASVLLDRIRAERVATPKPKRGRKSQPSST